MIRSLSWSKYLPKNPISYCWTTCPPTNCAKPSPYAMLRLWPLSWKLLAECDAVLVYYGHAGKAWVDIKLRELVKAAGYRDGRSALHPALTCFHGINLLPRCEQKYPSSRRYSPIRPR